MNLLNRNQNFASGTRRNITLQLIDLRSFASDDDPRPRRIDNDLQTIRRALDVNVRDARAGETPLQFGLELQVLDQKVAELLLRKPVRMPVFVVAEAKTVWMNFLAHLILRFRILNLKSEIQDLSLLFCLLLSPQGAT